MTGTTFTRAGIDRPDTRAAKRSASDAPRFMLGDWLVDVHAHRLERGNESSALEPRLMAVLAELCRRPGEVVGADALLDACWPGEALGDNPVHKVVAGLRRSLQDSATAPRYIETIRKQGYRLVAPIRVLSDQGPRSHQGGWRGQSPFRGLESFGIEHASVFFGRDGAVAELHARLAAQWQRGHPLVVLLGPSGSGKTSLVQAGLLPALLAAPAKADAHRAAPLLLACTAGAVDLAAFADPGPWAALAGALLDWECGDAPLLSGHSIESLAHALRGQPDEVLRLLRVGLAACQVVGSDGTPVTPPLLVLDRLEALFQAPAQGEAPAFIACIDRLVRSRLLLVLAVCRNDFYPNLADYPALLIDKEHGAHMDLATPDADAFAQIVRRPARAAGLIYGTDACGMNRLDDRLCAEALHARDALPMLQYTLQALYLGRAPGEELTWAAYDSLGGLEGAIGRRAEATLSGLPPGPQEALTRLLPRFVGLSTEDASPTSRWVSGNSIVDEDERTLLHALVEARLLVADHVAGATGFRVAHEALLRRWPRVTAWVAQHRTTLVVRGELTPWVRRWTDGARASVLLLPRGTMLWQASAAIADAPRLFEDDERAFVARSLARIRRHARWRWGASAGALCFAALAGLAAVRYAQLARIASERELQSQRLASFMLGDLADQLRPIGKLDLLHSIATQGLKLLGEGTRGETPQDDLQRAKALVVIGEVNSSRGKAQTAVATAALRKAGRLLEPLARSHAVDSAEVYKTLGASNFWLGQIAFDAEDLETAGDEMSRYRETCEQWLAAAPGDARARTELGYAFNSLGSIAFKRGAWAQAGHWFEQSLAAKLALLAAQPQDEELLDAVANSRFWLAMTAHVQGQVAKALELYGATRSIQSRLLTEHPGQASRLHDLSVTDVHRADTLQALGRPVDAEGAMTDAVDGLRQAAAADPSNRRWRAEILHAQARQVLMRLDAGMQADVELRALQQQLAQAADASSSGDLWWQTQAAVATALTEIAARQGDWRRVTALAADADTIVMHVLQVTPRDWRASAMQARLDLLVMRAHATLGETREQTQSCARARDRLQPAVDSGQGGQVLEAWMLARACAGTTDKDGAWMDRLTSGGYRPTEASLFTTRNHPERSQ